MQRYTPLKFASSSSSPTIPVPAGLFVLHFQLLLIELAEHQEGMGINLNWGQVWPAVGKYGLQCQIQSFSSAQFSHSVVSDSLRPHELQHARPPCPSPSPGVHSNSRPSSRWCHPAISSSVVPFSSYPQSLPASESFPMSQLFAWGGQSTGVSALL